MFFCSAYYSSDFRLNGYLSAVLKHSRTVCKDADHWLSRIGVNLRPINPLGLITDLITDTGIIRIVCKTAFLVATFTPALADVKFFQDVPPSVSISSISS